MKPIFSIWINTKKTFQFLETRGDKENGAMVNTFFFFSSMVVVSPNSFEMQRIMGGNYYIGLLVFILMSGLMGVTFCHYIFSYVIWGIGKLFKGKSTIENTRMVLACSLIPNVLLLVVGLILLIAAIILDNKGLIGYSHPIASFILCIFTLKIMVVGLRYFNKYSYLFAILTVITPILMILGLIYGLKILIL